MVDYEDGPRRKTTAYHRHRNGKAVTRDLRRALLERDDIEPDMAAREESAALSPQGTYVPAFSKIPTTVDELEEVLAELGKKFRDTVTREDFLPCNQMPCRCGRHFLQVLGERLTNYRCLPCYAKAEYGIILPEHTTAGQTLALSKKRQARKTKNPIIFNSYLLQLLEHQLQGEDGFQHTIHTEQGHLTGNPSEDPHLQEAFFETAFRMTHDRH
jgi:hypothetical protein